MTLPVSGALSMSQVNTELGLSSSATIALGGSGARGLAGIASGAINMNALHGKSAITIGMSVAPYITAGNANTSGSVTASFTLNSNGTCSATAAPITDEANYPANWATSTTTGIGSSYWARVTVTSGSLTSGTTGSWVQLSSNTTWSKNTTGTGGATVLFTLEIASDSGGSNILVTKTGCHLQYIHNYQI